MEKLIKCKTCGGDMASSAKVCPACGAKNEKTLIKKWWFWAIIVLVIIAVSASTGNNVSKPNETESTNQQEVNSPKISKAEFEALETGMTYEQAIEIIGGEGSLSSQVDLAGYNTVIYMWEGEGSIGANANVTFQNNSLTAKAQFGLK